MKKSKISINELRQICLVTTSGLKAFEDLNIFQKIVYKIRIKRFLKKNYKPLVINQLTQEKLLREDLSYNEYIQKYFKRSK